MTFAVPSMDLLSGKAVRLKQGKLESAEVLGEPLELAAKYSGFGFPWLHIVDLDAAFEGIGNRQLLPELAEGCSRGADARKGMKIQWGGGIRTVKAAEETIAAGAARVVFGTGIFTSPQEVLAAVDSLGSEKIWASLDFSGKPPVAKIRGWTEGAGADVSAAIAAAEACKVGGAVVSSVDADGMMQGPLLSLASSAAREWKKPLWLAGGMRNAEDAKAAFAAGAQAAIFGRALYSKGIDLGELSCLQEG